MSKQTTHQVLQTKNVTQFISYTTTKTSKFYNQTPTSASADVINVVNGSYAVFSGSFLPSVLEQNFKAAGSSSLDVTEVLGLIDRRLNPELYRKHLFNTALASGSTYNEAFMYAVNNS